MSTLQARFGGECIKLGDNINSDVIIPGRYLVSIDPQELAKHAFEPLGEDFQRKLRGAKVLVAGRNFGCGSAREQAASCLIGAGIQGVVAKSFARVFFRNAINTGLIAVESPDAAAAASSGDEVYIHMQSGQIDVGGDYYAFPPYPESLLRILEAGGLIPYLARSLARPETPR